MKKLFLSFAVCLVCIGVASAQTKKTEVSDPKGSRVKVVAPAAKPATTVKLTAEEAKAAKEKASATPAPAARLSLMESKEKVQPAKAEKH